MLSMHEAFHDPWPKSVCQRYVLYPEILKIFTATAIGSEFVVLLLMTRSRVLPSPSD